MLGYDVVTWTEVRIYIYIYLPPAEACMYTFGNYFIHLYTIVPVLSYNLEDYDCYYQYTPYGRPIASVIDKPHLPTSLRTG